MILRTASESLAHQACAEATLKTLVKQKQDKVEEIKKKTGYYTTRDLLEKYDEALKKGVRLEPFTRGGQRLLTHSRRSPLERARRRRLQQNRRPRLA